MLTVLSMYDECIHEFHVSAWYAGPPFTNMV